VSIAENKLCKQRGHSER